jgi:hypothetical protein
MYILYWNLVVVISFSNYWRKLILRRDHSDINQESTPRLWPQSRNSISLVMSPSMEIDHNLFQDTVYYTCSMTTCAKYKNKQYLSWTYHIDYRYITENDTRCFAQGPAVTHSAIELYKCICRKNSKTSDQGYFCIQATMFVHVYITGVS